MPDNNDTVNREAIRAAAVLLGSVRTERKAKAVRENGKLGGTPRLFIPCASGKPHHRWLKGRCRFCGHTKAALRVRGAKRTWSEPKKT